MELFHKCKKYTSNLSTFIKKPLKKKYEFAVDNEDLFSSYRIEPLENGDIIKMHDYIPTPNITPDIEELENQDHNDYHEQNYTLDDQKGLYAPIYLYNSFEYAPKPDESNSITYPFIMPDGSIDPFVTFDGKNYSLNSGKIEMIDDMIIYVVCLGYFDIDHEIKIYYDVNHSLRKMFGFFDSNNKFHPYG